MDWMRGKRERGRLSGRIFPHSVPFSFLQYFVHRISGLKRKHGRSTCDAGTVLLDRISNTDGFSRRGGGYVFIMADSENKVQE